MSFATVEMSRQDGTPVSLYLFTWGRGANAYYAYTDAEESILHDGKTYQPIPIGRDDIEAKGGLDRSTLQIDVTLDSEIAELYGYLPPTFPVTLVIKQGHIDDGEFKTVFSGRTVGANREGPLCKILAEPYATTLKNPGLRRNYQYLCPYVLYGTQCKADSEAVKQMATVTAIGKSSVTVPSGWNGPIAADRFPGGYITWTDANGNTQVRTILSAVGDVLNLTLRVTDLSAGNSIDILPGCNHQVSDCTNLHKEVNTGNSNIVNYGGQKDIPLENPVTYTKNVFY